MEKYFDNLCLCGNVHTLVKPYICAGSFKILYVDGKVYAITTSMDGNNVMIVNVKSVNGTNTVVLDRNTNIAWITEVNAAGIMVINETIKTADPVPGLHKMDAMANSSTLIASGSETMWKYSYSVTKTGPPAYYNWAYVNQRLPVLVRQEWKRPLIQETYPVLKMISILPLKMK